LANARDAEAFDRAVDLRIMRNPPQESSRIRPNCRDPPIRGGGYLFSPVGEGLISGNAGLARPARAVTFR